MILKVDSFKNMFLLLYDFSLLSVSNLFISMSLKATLSSYFYSLTLC